MIMWILAIVLMALTILAGYRQGVVRVAIALVGPIAGVLLAMPLAPYFEFPFRFIKVHPATPQFISPLIAFLVVSFAFKMIGAFFYRKVEYHYRYRVSDGHRAFWERMQARVGACLGAVNGLIYFLVFSVFIAVVGYLAVQAGGAESGSRVFSAAASAAEDLQSTGMDKVVAPFNPAPEKYFETSDILGLLYHNRAMIDRVENYPYFAAMADRPMFQAMGSNRDFQQLVRRQTTLEELLENAQFREIVTNADLYNDFMGVDLKDLRAYLETGVSPKFSSERILGRWAYDVNSTLSLNKALNPDVTASMWLKFRSELMERFDGTIFTAFYDKRAALKLSGRMEGRESPLIPGGRTPTGQTNMIPRWLNPGATFSASGKWSGSAPNYLVSLGNQNGTATSEAKLEGNRLWFQFEGKALSFVKLPE